MAESAAWLANTSAVPSFHRNCATSPRRSGEMSQISSRMGQHRRVLTRMAANPADRLNAVPHSGPRSNTGAAKVRAALRIINRQHDKGLSILFSPRFGVACAAFPAKHSHHSMRQQPLPRTRLNAPRLVRMLAAQGEIGAIDADGKTSFAERVSHWIALTDAIALGRVLGMPARPASSRTQAPAEASAVLASLQAQLARLQATLASPEACGGGSRRSQVRMPAPPSGTVGAASVDFAPYRHFYLAQQRDMEANVNLLRAAARDALDGLPDAARSLRARSTAHCRRPSPNANARCLPASRTCWSAVSRPCAARQRTMPRPGCCPAGGSPPSVPNCWRCWRPN